MKKGYSDGFLTHFAASGNSLIYSTYFGGGPIGESTYIAAIAVDNAGNVYATGATRSSLHPLVNPIQPTLNGYEDAFITIFNNTGSELLYSTYLGGNSGDDGTSIAVDDNNQVSIVGVTTSSDFPTVNAVQPNYASGGNDMFITKINSSGSALIFSTYLGGSRREGYIANVAVTQSGQVSVIVDTSSFNFPLANPFQSRLLGGRDFVVVGLSPIVSAFWLSAYLGCGVLPP